MYKENLYSFVVWLMSAKIGHLSLFAIYDCCKIVQEHFDSLKTVAYFS